VIVAPWQLFVIRVVDRVGKGLRTSPRDALIADSTGPSVRGRAFGFQRGMDNVGAAFGPLLAAGFLWLWPTHVRALFLVTLLPGLLVVVLLLLGLREAPATGPPPERLRLTLRPFDRGFRRYLLALLVFTLGMRVTPSCWCGRASSAWPRRCCRCCGAPCHVVKSTSNLLLGRAVEPFRPSAFIFLGWFVFAGVYLAFALATMAWEAWPSSWPTASSSA